MIQRIQTVYWLAAVILLGVFIPLPLFEFTESGNQVTIHSTDVNFIYRPIIGQIVFILIIIFLFKRRLLQIALGYVVLVNLIAICFGVFVKYMGLTESHPELKIQPWVFTLLIPIGLHVLAIRAVKKDEALIKSMDRLR